MNSFLRAPPQRRNRRLLVGSALAVLAVFIFLARAALFPFFLGLALAYLLLPLVRTLEALVPFSEGRKTLARILAIGMVYLLALVLVLLVTAFILPVVSGQVARFFEQLPTMVTQARAALEAWIVAFRATVPPEVREQAEEMIARIVQNLATNAQDATVRTVLVATQTFSVLLGLITIPVWLFYVLKDQRQAQEFLYQLFPPNVRPDVAAIGGIVDRILSSYIRAQLFLGLLVGIMTGVGLALLGVPFALVLGIIAGITELIPILGPILGSIAAVLVTLAIVPDKVLWVILLFIVVQQVENNILVPRIQGHAVAIHPAIIIVLLIMASEVAGLWGMLLIVPVAAVCKGVFLHLYHRAGAEEQDYTM